MYKENLHGITLYCNEEDKQDLTPVRQACEQTIGLMQDHYGISVPQDCRIYLMTSWSEFMFQSAPWPWKIYLALSFPLWARRVSKTWPYAGGWAQKIGKRQVVGVKPARLLQSANRDLGNQIFVRWDDPEKEVRSITCHELTHAFTVHLRLPAWLNEGLAMNMVDAYFGEQTVKADTLERLSRSSPAARERRNPGVDRQEAMLDLYVRGYWLTRYIGETHPALLKELLSHRHHRNEMEGKVAQACGMSVKEFWCEIDGILVVHFN